MAIKYSCLEYSNIAKRVLKNAISTLKKKPTLVVIQVDNNAASSSYINGKRKDCEEVGIRFEHVKIDSEKYSQNDLCKTIKAFDNDELVHGIIIQLPIPNKYNIEELQKCISPEKDVDGFRKDSCHEPCTPKGIIKWLGYNDYEFCGKDVTVIGRSKIVGKPLVNMLIDRGATVTCCNSHSNCKKYTLFADLVISAIGKPKHFTNYDFDDRCSVIVDVGINRDENNKLCGDVDYDLVTHYLPDTYVTPVPNGAGRLTRITLLENVLDAYRLLEDE